MQTRPNMFCSWFILRNLCCHGTCDWNNLLPFILISKSTKNTAPILCNFRPECFQKTHSYLFFFWSNANLTRFMLKFYLHVVCQTGYGENCNRTCCCRSYLNYCSLSIGIPVYFICSIVWALALELFPFFVWVITLITYTYFSFS
uniref:Uncharacterized protein n=1 Tax=Panagrolaimus sp. JU765 TaxID=591449 RepID=A0AC34Q5U6_9BILA